MLEVCRGDVIDLSCQYAPHTFQCVGKCDAHGVEPRIGLHAAEGLRQQSIEPTGTCDRDPIFLQMMKVEESVQTAILVLHVQVRVAQQGPPRRRSHMRVVVNYV